MIGNVRDRIGYLHIPKTAGSSATEAIQRAVRSTVDADGRHPSLCLKPYDRTLFGNFDLDELPEHQQSQIFTGTHEDMATFDVVIGHYSVQMLRSGRESLLKRSCSHSGGGRMATQRELGDAR